MGRPTNLTKKIQDEICGYIENGSSFVSAYRLTMVSETSFYEWKQQGEKDLKEGKTTIFSEFAESIKRANEKCKAWNIQQIRKAGESKKYWTACAWLLERKWPDEFGRRLKTEISGDVKITKETKEERTERLLRIKELMKRQDENNQGD